MREWGCRQLPPLSQLPTSGRSTTESAEDTDPEPSFQQLEREAGLVGRLQEPGAEGEWARTRPIWNQVPYDITTVRDDGTIVRFPRPSWSQYNAFRAQPAHDGDHPDLSPRVTSACADSCDDDGTITLTVVVDNLGSVDAPAGADLVLSTWAQGEPWIDEALRITLPDPVPAGGQSPEYAFSLPVSQWKHARVLDVWGTHDDECDYVNDRIDVAEDPCPPQ